MVNASISRSCPENAYWHYGLGIDYLEPSYSSQQSGHQPSLSSPVQLVVKREWWKQYIVRGCYLRSFNIFSYWPTYVRRSIRIKPGYKVQLPCSEPIDEYHVGKLSLDYVLTSRQSSRLIAQDELANFHT